MIHVKYQNTNKNVPSFSKKYLLEGKSLVSGGISIQTPYALYHVLRNYFFPLLNYCFILLLSFFFILFKFHVASFQNYFHTFPFIISAFFMPSLLNADDVNPAPISIKKIPLFRTTFLKWNIKYK